MSRWLKPELRQSVALASDSTAHGAVTGQAERTDIFQGKLLASALEPMLAGKRLVVLDLGLPRSGTIAFFSGFACRLGIAGVTPALAGINAEENAERRLAYIQGVVPEDLFGGVDLVLCWDLLNYLSLPAIGSLMDHVGRLMRRGGLVHALVAYGASALPDPPQPIVLREDGWLVRQGDGSGTRPAPRYPTGELQRVMPGYRVERAMLLRNGTQEYLFRR